MVIVVSEPEPQNILDALVDSMIKPRELKDLLVDIAWEIRIKCIEERYSYLATRELIRSELTRRLENRAFPSAGRKKMLDKVLSKVMKSYKQMLQACLIDDAQSAERERQKACLRIHG